jgi:sulfite exporter TauE/SafE
VRYQVGRLCGYAFAGSIAGQIGAVASIDAIPPLLFPVLVAGALFAMALRPWLRSNGATTLVQLQRAAPQSRRTWNTLARLLPRDPLLLGALTALLPCGALATGLLLAAASGNAARGALTMLGFALTSAIGVLASSWIMIRIAGVRRLTATRAWSAVLLLLGMLVLWRPLHAASADADPHAGPHAAYRCH